MIVNGDESTQNIWRTKYIKNDCLKVLLNIFNNGK